MKPTIIVETILPGLSYEERFRIVKEAGFDAVGRSLKETMLFFAK